MYENMQHRARRVLVTAVFLAVLVPTGTAFAQEEGNEQGKEEVKEEAKGPNRSGFTLLLTMGLGLQSNEFIDESTTGLGGMNLGIGGFASPNLAVMFRFSGTNVSFDSSNPSGRNTEVVSGVGGPAIQYWVNDSFNLEAGAGIAFANSDPGTDERGFGLMFGAAFSFFHRGKNSLQVGVEYAPVFLDGANVHNVCIAFGWQLL